MNVQKLNPLPWLWNYIKQTGKEIVTPSAYVKPTTFPGGFVYGLGAGFLGKYLENNHSDWTSDDTKGLEMIAAAPLWGTLLSLGGSTPQNDDMKWKRLGYDSKEQYDFFVERNNRNSLDLSGRGDMDTDFAIQYEPQTDSYLLNSGIKPTVPGTEAGTSDPQQVPPSEQVVPQQGASEPTRILAIPYSDNPFPARTAPVAAPSPEQMDSNLQSTKDQLLGDATQQLREGATNYGDFTKEQLDAYYSQLRKTDPAKAVEWGLGVNKSLFGYD